jgi:hopanoid biosynthesis associated RND transporter like protein HpnN
LLLPLLRAQIAYPKLFLIGALILVVACLSFTLLKLQIHTSHKVLIAQDNHLMQLLDKAEQFSELDSFVVVIENRDTPTTIAFADLLAQRLKADTEHYDQVFAGVDISDFRRWALLYLSTNDLSSLLSKMNEHAVTIERIANSPGLVTLFEELNSQIATEMVGELFTGFLDEGPSKEKMPQDLTFLIQLLDGMKRGIEGSGSFTSPWGSLFDDKGGGIQPEDGYNWTDDKKYLVISVAAKLHGDGVATAGESLHALRQTIAELKGRFPGINVGVTGQKALDEDETEVAFRGMSWATLLSLFGLASLLILFWRGLRRPLIELFELIVAVSLTFGLTTAVIGHLNLLSVAFAPMILGLGIDYGIHWFSRYMEEQGAAGASRKEALTVTMAKVGPTVLLAGVCAALSFFPLMLAGFKGLAELGLICAMGMCATTLTTLGLLPALILLFDRQKVAPHAVEAPSRTLLPFPKPTKRLSLVLVGIAGTAFLISLFGATKVRFDLNTLHLQSKTAESVIWEKKLIENSSRASIHGVLFAHSLSEVERKSQAVERLPTVAGVQSILDLTPSDQAQKLVLLQRLKPVVSNLPSLGIPGGPVDIERLDRALGRIGFKMGDSEAARLGADRQLVMQMKKTSELIDNIRRQIRQRDRVEVLTALKTFEGELITDLNNKLDLLKTGANARAMTFEDIPKPLVDRFVGPDNLFLIRVLPAHYIWDPDALAAFVRDLRSVDPDATGDPVTLSIFTRAFRDACIWAAIYSVIFIFVFLVATLRSLILTFAALVPLVLGTVWTFGLMQVFGIQLNLANTIFLPLILGAAVEYGIVITRRWRQDHGDVSSVILPSSTAKGVIMAGLTTTVGFGSLVISEHQGIKSLGLLATIGSLSVLAAAIIFLPSLLHLSTPFLLRRSKEQKCNKPFQLGQHQKNDGVKTEYNKAEEVP